MKYRIAEILVGFFVLLAIIAALVLALRVSGLTSMDSSNGYQISAEFDNIGGLKEGAPVTISGVKIGDVEKISYDAQTFSAKVQLKVFKKTLQLPDDTVASIVTAGILGAQYISLSPGSSDTNLKANGVIESTHSALILENIIGQLLFKLKKS
jgi:phospholipid/cholesterol/gamma-HCH transport system substrate-binding protein